MENKKYGYYPGLLKDPDLLQEPMLKAIVNGNEADLYFIIVTLNRSLWETNQSIERDQIEITKEIKEWLQEIQYTIEFCIFNTRRFGVEIPEPKDGEHVEITASYKAWYSWWNNYFQHTLNKKEFKEFDILYCCNRDISKYRPEGDWRDQLS